MHSYLADKKSMANEYWKSWETVSFIFAAEKFNIKHIASKKNQQKTAHKWQLVHMDVHGYFLPVICMIITALRLDSGEWHMTL